MWEGIGHRRQLTELITEAETLINDIELELAAK